VRDLKIVAFDLEITRGFGHGEDWVPLLPLGISCAGTHKSTEEDARVWHGLAPFDGADYPESLSVEGCTTLAEYLVMAHNDGYRVVTWNGAGFDFRVLRAELEDPKLQEALITVLRDHYDLAFQLFASRGFLKSLDDVAKDMGLPGKPEEVHGAIAPLLWSMGKESQDKVLDYVANDADMVYYLYQAILMAGEMRWMSRTGKPARFKCSPILTVEESMALDEPDVSWMDDPWKKERFVGWL